MKPFTLKAASPQEKSITVKIGDSELTLTIRPPALRDELAALFSRTAGADRILSAVVGWQGVVDADGQPVPFTHEALAQLIRQSMAVRDALVDAVQEFYRTDETHEGN